jgi:hypothetical protein
MHSAPAVRYPVGRSRFQAWLIGLTASGGAVTGLLWYATASAADWRPWLLFMTLLGSCVAAGRAWHRTLPGSLHWDGQTWCWHTADAATCGVLTAHLDFQFCLVLSLRPDTGVRLWLWPERTAEVTRWNALRRAVFSRGGTGQTQGA